MEKSTKESGKEIKCTEEERLSGEMAKDMKDNLSMTSVKATGYSGGKMAESTMENGKTENSMASEFSHPKIIK